MGSKFFEPYMTAGADEIFPDLLQRGADLLIPRLIALFRSSFIAGYIPTCWRESNVIFAMPGRLSHWTTLGQFA